MPCEREIMTRFLWGARELSWTGRGSSKFTKRRRVAGPRAAGRNLMETEWNTATNQLAPLSFTFGRPLSCLRRDNCQRWTCFINADTPARTRLCERGTPTVTRIRLPCNTSSPRCGSWTYLPVAAELNEFVYSFTLELYFFSHFSYFYIIRFTFHGNYTFDIS